MQGPGHVQPESLNSRILAREPQEHTHSSMWANQRQLLAA